MSEPIAHETTTDPEVNPEVMYAHIEEANYKSELEIFDRWQSFSVELLRLSLLGIAIFGFLYQQVFANFDSHKNPNVPIALIKFLSQVSVALFAASTVCALLYRYGSTEAMLHYLRGLRNPLAVKSELESRIWWLSKCLIFKILSAVCLGVGAILAAVAIFKLL
jgi:hypothetical protein